MTFLLDQDAPDDIAYSLKALGHEFVKLRNVLPVNAEDPDVLDYAIKQGWILITCNRDDFLALGNAKPDCGIIILIRRKTRAEERTAIVRLIDRAGESGLANNINFA